tara:strand:+ start:21 stop:1262 length:1242 start_codon:yes stop_codon:yes gene_type:complete
MDNRYYSQETFDDYIFSLVCQKDATLTRYLSAGNVKAFRNRLSKFKDADKNIEKAILALFTVLFRQTLLQEVSRLTRNMAPLGFLVVSGGEAVNKYLPLAERSIVSDIDTKFVPSVVGVSAQSPKYFGYIQMAKILMWHYLARICFRLNYSKNFREILLKLQKTNVGKCLGISSQNPAFKRRYSLIKKSRNTRRPVLIDVEIMALDISGIRHFVPSKGQIMAQNIGGILDIAYMRKGEVGCKVCNNITMGIENFPNVLVGGKKFIEDDLKMMINLKLRPKKLSKNKVRLANFMSRAKSCAKATVCVQRKRLTQARVKYIAGLSPYYGAKYTTQPVLTKIQQQLCPGRLNSNRFYRFDPKKRQWIKNTRAVHIKNERGPCNKLYGYHPRRDAWVPSAILHKARRIPFVGLKITR